MWDHYVMTTTRKRRSNSLPLLSSQIGRICDICCFLLNLFYTYNSLNDLKHISYRISAVGVLNHWNTSRIGFWIACIIVKSIVQLNLFYQEGTRGLGADIYSTWIQLGIVVWFSGCYFNLICCLICPCNYSIFETTNSFYIWNTSKTSCWPS